MMTLTKRPNTRQVFDHQVEITGHSDLADAYEEFVQVVEVMAHRGEIARAANDFRRLPIDLVFVAKHDRSDGTTWTFTFHFRTPIQ